MIQELVLTAAVPVMSHELLSRHNMEPLPFPIPKPSATANHGATKGALPPAMERRETKRRPEKHTPGQWIEREGDRGRGSAAAKRSVHPGVGTGDVRATSTLHRSRAEKPDLPRTGPYQGDGKQFKRSRDNPLLTPPSAINSQLPPCTKNLQHWSRGSSSTYSCSAQGNTCCAPSLQGEKQVMCSFSVGGKTGTGECSHRLLLPASLLGKQPEQAQQPGRPFQTRLHASHASRDTRFFPMRGDLGDCNLLKPSIKRSAPFCVFQNARSLHPISPKHYDSDFHFPMNSKELKKDSESCWAMTNVSLKTKTNRINSKGCKGKIGYQVMKFTTEDHEEKDDGKRMVKPGSMDVPRLAAKTDVTNLREQNTRLVFFLGHRGEAGGASMLGTILTASCSEHPPATAQPQASSRQQARDVREAPAASSLPRTEPRHPAPARALLRMYREQP
ncbi:hypothetical protein Anapl_15166 [Anas platyrhynchos]|uniref:Uncharacterized protein n=1 Tax=Anas platyrhynchos TaxID=8839 RepID=R0KQK8_ANAPL|nr:hypothetical protein Anapl_15166 [Anas platyrhynchos]